MFNKIAPMLTGSYTLLMSLTRVNEDLLRLTITPHNPEATKNPELQAARAALDKPIVVEGTADELDVELAGKLESYVTRRTTLVSAFDDLEQSLAEAEKLVKEKAAQPKQAAAAPATPKAAIPTITKPAPAAPVKPESKTPSLF